MAGFAVDPADLGGHAERLTSTADALHEAASACRVALSHDAYGALCRFLVAATNGTGTALADLVGRGASAVTGHGAAVGLCRQDYERFEAGLVARFGGGS